MVNLSDGFIFTFSDLKIEDISSQLIFREILSFIKNKNESFDFNNCLFNLNYIDKFKSKDIDYKIKDFKDNIQKKIINNIYKGNLIEKLKLKEKIKSADNLHISYFSNQRYEKYKKNILFINKMEFLNDNKNISLKDVYDDLKDNYNEIELETNIDDGRVNQRNIEILNKIGNNLPDEEKLYIEKISKFVLSIIEQKKELKIYKTSYADIFFTKFREQIYYSYNNNNKLILMKFSSFLFKILLKLYYIDKLCLNPEIMKLAQENIEDKKQIIIQKYNEFIKKVENEFDGIIEHLNEIKKKIIIIENTDAYKIIKEYKLDDIIDNLMNNVINEINEMNSFYYEFCFNQISELFENEGNFIKILQFIVNVGEIQHSLFEKFFLINIKIISFFLVGNDNEYQLKMFFEEKEEKILKHKKEYTKEIEKRKDIFINELDNLNNISIEEIHYLKKIKFNEKFQQFINYIDNYK